MFSNKNIKNWKLLEVENEIEIVKDNSSEYFNFLVKELNIPITNHKAVNRKFTYIDWVKMSIYNKFFLDDEFEDNEAAFKSSELSKKENIIILYGFNEPAVLVPTNLFISDWEDFIASSQWEVIIFSEDFKLIMEVSRDYYLHANFYIR